MRNATFLALFCAISFVGYTQGLQIEDTMNITRVRWRDTCFGLINNSTSIIPSGYLLDYSMVAFESGKYDLAGRALRCGVPSRRGSLGFGGGFGTF